MTGTDFITIRGETEQHEEEVGPKKISEIHVLLLDDIDAIANKECVQRMLSNNIGPACR